MRGGFGNSRIKVDRLLSQLLGVPEGTLLKYTEFTKGCFEYVKRNYLGIKVKVNGQST